MRIHFSEAHGVERPLRDEYRDTRIHMTLWYGMLHVVIEGWHELKETDAEIDGMLNDNVDLLRRFRNGAFHFQKEEFDDRFMKLITDGTDVVAWVTQLTAAFGRWFDEQERANPTSTKVWEILEAIQPQLKAAIAEEMAMMRHEK